MLTTSTLPLLLQKAAESLSTLVDGLSHARPDCVRAMRPERKKSLIKLLACMIQSCSLQHSGTLVAVNGPYVRPKTVKEYALQTGLTVDNVKNCLADLRALNYLQGSQVKRKNPISGQLEVSPGLRQFTKKFWSDLGLLELFKKQVAWAKRHARKKLFLPFRAVKAKVQDTVKEAGQVVKQVMGQLKKAVVGVPSTASKPQIPLIPASSAPPGESYSDRVKRNCSSILAMLKRNKS